MAKVQEGDADLLWGGVWLTVRAMRAGNGRYPAKEWFDALDKQCKGRVLAAFQGVENSWRSGRPTGGRVEKVKASKTGLSELRATRAGSTPPHLRMLILRRGQAMWVAHGFKKQKNKLPQAEIDAGDRVAAHWMSVGD